MVFRGRRKLIKRMLDVIKAICIVPIRSVFNRSLDERLLQPFSELKPWLLTQPLIVGANHFYISITADLRKKGEEMLSL